MLNLIKKWFSEYKQAQEELDKMNIILISPLCGSFYYVDLNYYIQKQRQKDEST
jgi:hypothetical protein